MNRLWESSITVYHLTKSLWLSFIYEMTRVDVERLQSMPGDELTLIKIGDISDGWI